MSAGSYHSHDEDGHPPLDHNAITVHSHADAPIESPSVDSLAPPTLDGWLTKRGYKMGCIPSWKRRWFVLKGQYIFKFESPTSSRPKGVPIPVLGASCTLGPIDPSSAAASNGHKATMTLSTIRKDYVLGAVDVETLQLWIDAIARARALTIKQELGHAPVSDSEAFANRSGAFLTQRKLDLEQEQVEESRRGRYEG